MLIGTETEPPASGSGPGKVSTVSTFPGTLRAAEGKGREICRPLEGRFSLEAERADT